MRNNRVKWSRGDSFGFHDSMHTSHGSVQERSLANGKPAPPVWSVSRMKSQGKLGVGLGSREMGNLERMEGQCQKSETTVTEMMNGLISRPQVAGSEIQIYIKEER